MRQVLILLVFVMTAGCHQLSYLTEGIGKPRISQIALSGQFPSISVADARQIMEEKGFVCELKKNTSIKVSDDDREETARSGYEGVDCLYCWLKQNDGPSVTRTTSWVLIFKGDLLVDVRRRVWPTSF